MSQFQPPGLPPRQQPDYPQWQQPPYPPQPETYYQPPSQPLPPPGYQPYPQQPMPGFSQWQQLPQTPMQPAPQPPKRGIKKRWIVVVAIVLLVIIAIAAGSHGSQSPTASSTPTAQPTQVIPTSQPTTAPTHKATQVPAKSTIGNQVVVGATEAAFTAKYGNPTSQTTQNGAQELSYNVSDKNIGQFAIVLASDNKTVYGIVIAPPGVLSWDALTAITVCVAYMPADVKLDGPQNVTDSSGNVTGGLQVGHSVELANSVDPSLFNDASGNGLVSPGTLSTKYTYTDSTGTAITVCALRLGEQSTTSS